MQGIPTQVFSAWREEGCPKFRGEKYATLFRDIDSWTEYWDLYRPDTNGRFFFGNGPDHPGFLAAFWPSPKTPRVEAFERWREFAKFHRTPDAQDLLAALTNELAAPGVKEALVAVDDLIMEIATHHFGLSDGAFDGLGYLDCVERYACDVLPPDHDRFNRVPGGDDRKDHSLHHTMDGAVMWFNWLGHLDCTALVRGNDDPHRLQRATLVAAANAGSAFDYVFRNRGRTRSEYRPDEPTRQLLRSRAARWSTDLGRGLTEGRDLYAIFAGAAAG